MLSIYEFLLRTVLREKEQLEEEEQEQGMGSSSFSFHRSQVVHFLFISALWLLRESFLASHLCSRYQLTLKEFSALRKCFLVYDNELSNEIERSDLTLLLQVSDLWFPSDQWKCFSFKFKFFNYILGFGRRIRRRRATDDSLRELFGSGSNWFDRILVFRRMVVSRRRRLRSGIRNSQ
jgi:hypothetical protein